MYPGDPKNKTPIAGGVAARFLPTCARVVPLYQPVHSGPPFGEGRVPAPAGTFRTMFGEGCAVEDVDPAREEPVMVVGQIAEPPTSHPVRGTDG